MATKYTRIPSKGETPKVMKNKPQTDLKARIDGRIDKLTASEKTTREELSGVSREVLEYLVLNGSTDIGTVNRLLSVLTPRNKIACTFFFDHFLPWKLDKKTGTFGGMINNKAKRDKCFDMVKEFLAEPGNDVWSWSRDNIEEQKKDFDLASNVTKAVTLALNGKDESNKMNAADPISPIEIMSAVLRAGISLDDAMTAINNMPDPAVEEDNKATEEQAA
jgi:hypothetical protein